MKKNISAIIASVILIIMMLPSCNEEEYLKEVPRDILSADNLFNTKEGFRDGLNAVYASARNEKAGWIVEYTGCYPFAFMSMGVDNCWGNFIGSAEYPIQYFKEYNNQTFTIYNTMFLWLYKIVNSTNTIIERADKTEIEWASGEKEELVAEAKTLRAWAYRHLTYLWGDVPLSIKESTGSTIKLDWERTPVAEIYKLMESDLLYASDNLPVKPDLPGRLTSSVANYYLTELYLLLGKADKAEEYGKKIIDSGNYKLITQRYGVNAKLNGTPFSDQFFDGNVLRTQGNTEVIWEWLYEPDVLGGGATWLRNYWEMKYWNLSGVVLSKEIGGRGVGRQSLTKKALELYEPKDDRYSNASIRWYVLKSNGDTIKMTVKAEAEKNNYWPSIKKFDYTHPDPVRVSDKNGYGDLPYLRLADVYLLLSEATFKQGKNAEAANYINIVRQRSKATTINAGQVTLDFILDERSRELVGEEYRRYTLLRTGTWLTRTRSMNPISGPSIAERDKLFPIPQAVIDANINSPMSQNPGY